MEDNEYYRRLVQTLRHVALLDSIGSLLGWDERTHLPPRGTAHRADQLGLIARLTHEQFTSPRIDELLREVEHSTLFQSGPEDADLVVNVRETRRLYDRARKLPTELVEEMTRTAVLAEAAWVEARRKSDFASFEPWLAKTLELKRREAECVGYRSNPYDALLDAYEPRETADGVQRVFDSFRDRLVELVGRVTSCGRKAPVQILHRKYPTALQQQFARDAAVAIGFDFDAGRLDVTVHPFCTGIGPGDTRLTTRYDENYFGDGFFSVLHEAGHGLYEQGLPKAEHFGLPVADSVSLGIHESQSRLWENFVGRSRAFWRYFFPKARDTFGDTLNDVSEDQWLWAINDIQPSLIRTEADEATYNLHIMLRFELEQAMLRDELKPRDLPAAWNQRMRQYLGLTPPDDARGCLQDIHWAGGAIGYFPTYSLGNLYAAQFFEQAHKDLGDLDGMFARGEFAPLLNWLREKIHRHGKRYSARQLVKRVTGSDLSADALMRHLARKASEYYGV
ncbi:carboxypeptidase M32 [Fontivita pretiosa]|uniref:carboxypeptidase M32 n=1 Tax=Fontivita pretiosa TaxID=2989684 RepID=UPI003D17F514